MFTNETTSFILRCVRKTIWMILVLWGIALVKLLCYPSGSGGRRRSMQTTLKPPCGRSGAGSS